MINYLSKIAASAALALGLSGCNPLPKYAREALEPLKEVTTEVCQSAGNDQKKFDSNLDILEFLAKDRKNQILDALGCQPGCIEWRCGRDDVFSEFEFYETKAEDCNCPKYDTDTLGEAIFFMPKPSRDQLFKAYSN